MTRLLIALLIVFASLPARAQDDVAAFYKGKVVRLIVGIGVGSGYDINARLLARYLPKYIPGNPSVIVQNQPGAGSLSMTNQLFAAGPFDGTAIGASFNGLPTTPLLQPTGARFEAVKLNWVGSTNRETQAMYVWHTSPIEKLDDLPTKEMIVGAQAPGSTQYDYPSSRKNSSAGSSRSSPATRQRRRSISRWSAARCMAPGRTGRRLKAISEQWIKEKKIRILAQWALRKHPELPDVPLILDQAKTEEQKQSLDLALARLEFGRPFFMPPNVPAERVSAHPPRVRCDDEGQGIPGRGGQAQDRDRSALRRAGRRADRADLQDAGRTVERVRDAMAPK